MKFNKAVIIGPDTSNDYHYAEIILKYKYNMDVINCTDIEILDAYQDDSITHIYMVVGWDRDADSIDIFKSFALRHNYNRSRVTILYQNYDDIRNAQIYESREDGIQDDVDILNFNH